MKIWLNRTYIVFGILQKRGEEDALIIGLLNSVHYMCLLHTVSCYNGLL